MFHSYRQAEGLKNLAVNAMAMDRSGFLWVATENGIYRFLGSGFELFGAEQGMPEIDIRDVVSDPGGILWVGTHKNLYRWDGGRFYPAGPNPIPIPYTRRMAVEDDRHLLVLNNNRLYRLEHDAAGRMLSLSAVFPDRVVNAMPELGQAGSVTVVGQGSGKGMVWFGCGKKLCSFPAGGSGPVASGGGPVTAWGTENGLAKDRWDGVLLDRAGTLWAAGQTHVAVLARGSARFAERGIPGSDPDNLYGHAPLIEDREGRVIVPSDDAIARWDGTGWRRIGRTNGLLGSTHITSMAFDGAGDLWLGSLGGGLYNWIGYQDWEGWNDGNGSSPLSSAIWAIAPAPGGRVVVGAERGPAWIDPRLGYSGALFRASRWTQGQISAIGSAKDGSFWATTFSGDILRLDPASASALRTARVPAVILSALEVSPGRILYSTLHGLWVGQDGAVPRKAAAVETLLGESDAVNAGCVAPDGAAWFLAGNRLLRFRDSQWDLPPIDGMNKLRGSQFALACARDGAIWLTGQQSGTWRLMPGIRRIEARQLELPPALRTLATVAILVDRRGWVWLGTDAGLVVWNGQSWRHLTQESGLIWNDVDQRALLAAPDGSLWVGTSGGVAHLMHPEHVFDSGSMTALVTEIGRGDALYPVRQQVALPWSVLPLRFRISSPAMRNRSEMVFQYRMEGFQSDWIDDPGGTALFSGLPPGSYTFLARAYNAGMNVVSGTVNIQVRVFPPWWRTRWFYTLLSFGVALLLLGVMRLYVRHVRRRSLELEELVRDRTRELEASREKLRIQATHDGLTGMLNRAGVLNALKAEMDRARRENSALLVVLVDLDHFKQLNDAHGHLGGDEALRRFAEAVRSAIRSYDHAGRIGGEEFLLVLTQISREMAAQRLASLCGSISNLTVSLRGIQIAVNCSMGATLYDPRGACTSEERLLSVADRALYEAKAAGRNQAIYREADDPAAKPAQSL